jgi:hypothetical protein
MGGRWRFAAILVAALLGGCAPRETVPAAAILARIKPGHPRVVLTASRLAALRTALATDPWLQHRYRSRKGKADEILAEPPSPFDLKGTDALLDTSRQVLERVATLALVYRIEGAAKYRDRCWAELDAAARFPDWQPQHFLNTAELTAAFAIGYDWLYDAWTDEQRSRLRTAIEQYGLKPGLDPLHARHWIRHKDNWNMVCNGGLGLGALAIADESPEIAGKILARSVASIPLCLAAFGPDGAWPEGPMYWGYTTEYASLFLDALETSCGTDFGLGDLPGMSQSGWFPLYLNGPAAGAFNFGDADEDKDPRSGPQLLWLARRFAEPRYAQYEIEHPQGRMSTLDLIWEPGIPRAPWQTIPTDRYFRGVEVATLRDRWNDPAAWFVGFKAGSNAPNHSHLDVGSFVLEAKGVRWAVDLGPDDYDLPGYFDESGRRWDYYRLRAEGHNTLVIDPGPGPDQAPSGGGRITAFTSGPQRADLAADLTGAYPGAQSVLRSIAFVRGRGMELTDAVRLTRRGELWWFFQTRARLAASPDGRTLTLGQSGQTLTLTLLQPATATFQTGPAEPLATSPLRPRQAPNPGVTRIAIHLSGVEQATIAVRFQ